MTRHHIFDPHVDSATRWLTELGRRLDLPANEMPRALHALRAGLHAIRDRLPASEVIDLSAQLPTLIRGIYFDGWTLSNDPHQIRDRGAMLARVRKELGHDAYLDPIDVLRGVIQLLESHVSRGEMEDVVATLPASIRSLWDDLLGDVPASEYRETYEHRH